MRLSEGSYVCTYYIRPYDCGFYLGVLGCPLLLLSIAGSLDAEASKRTLFCSDAPLFCPKIDTVPPCFLD
jgi:hypothetical protein